MRNECPARRQRCLPRQKLQARLDETQDVLRAIRNGDVDAVVVPGSQGEHVFTLKGAERSYRILIETMNEGAVTLMSDGTIAYSNSHFSEMVRMPLEQVIGTSFSAFLPAREHALFQALLEKSGNVGGKAEFKLQGGDGTLIPAQLSVRSLRDAPAGGFCLVITDLTAQKCAEQQRSYLAAIVESSDDAIIGKSIEGFIQSWNRGAERLYGYSASEAIGQSAYIVVPPERREELAGLLHRIQQGEGIERHETTRIRKDGRPIEVSVTISPLKDAEGKVVGASTITRDITGRKRIEEEMRKAKEAAEAANQAKSRFLANMSHEIRTPMNGVIGMAGLLLDSGLTAEQQEYAKIVRASGEALMTVINDILDFSKIEARKLTLEATAFDLQMTLENAAAVLALKASEKGLELICEVESGTPCLLQGDPGRLRQVLVNLLGNAVKFSHQGEVAIRVRLEKADERSATLRFTVSDTGIGFRKDRATTLFEPFVQGDGSLTRRYGGTGLGLAISKQLVEMMGGRIGVESEEGKGSTFWFTSVFEKQSLPGTIESDERASLRGMKVLVVDDNATNRSLVVRLLKSWGCRPAVSVDANSALAILRRAARGADPFQLALVDMTLPGTDGQELGGQIAADLHLEHTALVLMTPFGLRRKSDRERLQALGFAGQVSKPIWGHCLRDALLALSPNGSAPAASEVVVSPDPVIPPTKRHARILVAEDNLMNQKVALAMLKKLGYNAVLAASGVEVLQALSSEDYGVVLMDCEMPEMDGYEATRCIRERRSRARNPDIPIIALTADAISGDREKCLQAGMNDFLAKPVEPRHLAATLEKWLLAEHGGKEKSTAPAPNEKTEVVFDQEEMLTRFMDDRSLASELISEFLNKNPEHLRILKSKLEEGDAYGAQREAHTLKGEAATLSAHTLQALYCGAQEAAGAGDLSRSLALLPRMEEQFELLKATLAESGWV